MVLLLKKRIKKIKAFHAKLNTLEKTTLFFLQKHFMSIIF